MSNTCSIYKNTFFGDLYPFVINNAKIEFDTDSGKVTESINTNFNLSSFISNAQEYWKVAIIDHDNLVYNKAILGKTQVFTKVLGIEDAISFKPHFRHWTLSNPINMSCNWFVSSMFGGMDPEYGVMFWYRTSPINTILWSDISRNVSVCVNADVFNGDTKILNKGAVVTKISDNIVYDHTKATFNLSTTPVGFDNRNAYVDIGAVANKDNIFTLSNRNITIENQNIDLWISPGEALSFYNNRTEKARYNQSNISSYSYLSPGLFPVYREIYHSLTKRRPKGLAYNRKQSFALQKLCYFLSTSPLFDRTTTDILSTEYVYGLVQEYLTQDVPDISTEKTNLLSIIDKISEQYLKLSTSPNVQYITTHDQLISKVLNKYAAILPVAGGERLTISYKENISNHIIVSLGSVNTFNKGEGSDTVLYNNSSIRCGNLECASNFTDKISAMSLNLYNYNKISKSLKVPLADAAIPAVTVKDIFAGGVISKAWDTNNNPFSSMSNIPEMVLDEKLWQDAGASISEEGATYIWEPYGGENCIKFRDTSKDLNAFGRPIYPPIRRFNTTVNTEPTVFLRKSGTYELKVTRTLYRNVTQSDTVIITTDGNTELQNANFNPQTYTFNKNCCSSFKITAFNKYGMIWLLDTDNYYDKGSGTDTDDYFIYGVVRLSDVKLNIQPSDKLGLTNNEGGNFALSFSGGTAGFWVMAVEIEHMRDSEPSTVSCKSFYREKVARLTRNTKLILGSSDFGRISTNSYTFSARNCGDTENFKDITFNDPQPSTCFAPVLYSYGGYTKEQIDTIGIHMPFHPSPDPGSLCKKNLPLLPTRNPFQEIADKERYCFPEEVSYSNNSNIILSPGHFRPDTGWTDSQDLIGKTAVVSDMPHKHECLTFKGGGFYSLRPGGQYSSNIYFTKHSEESTDRINNQYGIGGLNSFYYANYSSRTFDQGGYDPWFNWGTTDDFNQDNICGGQITTYGIPKSLHDAVIESVEVKLNFLNYFNPKNLQVWLTCPGLSLSNSAPQNYVYSDPIDFSDTTMLASLGLSQYVDSLNNTHSNKIVLLNQEHIDNYQNNFSITFSDNADKFNVLSKAGYPEVSDEFQKILYLNKICNNNDKVLASLKSYGLNDIDSELRAHTIKVYNHNVDNDRSTIYRFSSLKGKKLSDLKFALNIKLMDYLINDGRLFDNLSYNDQMAGNTTTENLSTSNVSLNSLCSWEVMVYLKDIKNPVSYNYANGVDYSLINGNTYEPYVGYDYLMDFGSSTPIKSNMLLPLVNLNAPYPSIANVNRCSYNEETLGKSVFTPRAEFPSLIPYLTAGLGFGFGSIVGGMVALSALNHFLGNGGRNDPIINYFIETRLLNQTETTNGAYYKPVYDKKYFGQADRAVICLSNQGAIWHAIEVPIFRYINTPAMLPSIYKYIRLDKNNLGTLSDLEFKPIADVQEIDFAISPASNLSLDRFLHYNKHIKIIQYLDIPESQIESDLKKQNYIIVSGSRPFKFFAMKETVYVSSIDKNVEILNMALVLTKSGLKTIIALSEIVSDAGYISKAGAADTILLYREDKTSIIDESKYFSRWSANASNYELTGVDKAPEKNLSAYSPGSIGWGTSKVDPEMLYSLEYNSSNLQLLDLVSNNNDKILNNKLYIYTNNNLQNVSSPTVLSQSSTPTNAGLRGWTTTLDDFGYILHNNSYPISTGIHTFADKASPVFVELKCDAFKDMTTIPATGYIHIENHFINNDYINVFLTQKDLLNAQWSELNQNIADNIAQYNELQDDAAECWSISGSGPCPKRELKNTISDLISQRASLSYTLEKSVLNNKGYYTLPYGQTTIEKNRYKDWYWITIDPEQPSILVDELTIKIPQKLEMTALPIVGERVETSQILPNYYAKVDESQADAVRYFQSGNGSYTYTTPPKVIEEQKALLLKQYPGLKWEADETFIYGTSDPGLGDSKKLLIGLGELARDNLIAFKETYIRPKGTADLDNKKIKDVINLGSPLKAKFRNMPRQLQTIDSEDFDKYVYDKKGNIAKGTGTNARARSVGQLANNFVCWKCIDKQGVLVDPPPFFKILNEMHYRSFFGSADKVEHKSEFMDSQFAWEWIPYEFFPGECKVSDGQWDNPSLSVKNIMSLSGDVLMIAKTIITRTGSEIKFETFDLDLAVGDLIGRVTPVDGFCTNMFSIPPPSEFDLNRIVKCITTQMLPAETRIVNKREEEIVNNQPSAPTTIQYVSEIYKIELGDETNSSSTDFEFDDVGNCVEYTDTATITTNFMGSATAHRAYSIGALCAGSGQSVKISYTSLPQDTVIMLTGKSTPGCECVSMVFSEVASGDGTATVLIPNGASSVSLKVNSGDQRPTFSDSTLVEAECIK